MIKYDASYYYNLLKIHTHTAKAICQVRWDFILQLMPEFERRHPLVLDYGCGVGWFAAFKPDNFEVDTYDIMPVPQTGITQDKYDIVTMWDVLEHIPDFTELEPILKKTEFVALTLPVKPEGVDWRDWHHFKPGEHLHYYTKDLLEALFYMYGFELKIEGTPECPPRVNAHSFIFKRNGKK